MVERPADECANEQAYNEEGSSYGSHELMRQSSHFCSFIWQAPSDLGLFTEILYLHVIFRC